MANFSKRKNASRPASKNANKVRGSALDSKALGSACRNEVESIIPTERLTMRSTSLESSENENIAAKLMLSTPAMVVVNSIEVRTD